MTGSCRGGERTLEDVSLQSNRPAGPWTLVELLESRAGIHPDRGYEILPDGEPGAALRLTYAELAHRARLIAAHLREAGAAGERVLLLFPPGLDFIAGFFGCLYAGAVAVPAYPPRPRRSDPRLASIAADCRPRAVLTISSILARAASLAEAVPPLAAARWIATDELPDDAGSDPVPAPAPSAPAFLQYTSGSTGTPKGVVVTHANLVHNEEMIRRAFRQSESSVVVGWLPLYHDMGLIGNVLQPLWVGCECVLMPPVAFLQKPLRWLAAIDRCRATTSGGPNFAYDLCVRKIAPAERETLDLSTWEVAFNGAEPVRAETLERFAEAFAPCGFRREAFVPCYGLAEATLLVTAASGRADRSSPGPVSCGAIPSGGEVRLVDPESGSDLPPGEVGEIWVAGPSVAAGYWDRPEETERMFRAALASGEGPFLRTGDLGFLSGGELFVAGRLKDLIILRGRNHYPQDVERTAEAGSPALRPGCTAAFSVDAGDEERLVVVAEVERHADAAAAVEAVRRAVAEEHEVQVHEVVLVRTGTIPRTSSGKIRRQACREGYLGGGLSVVTRGGVGGDDWEAGLEAGSSDLLAWLRGEIARLVRGRPESVDPALPLISLGVDSLAAVELQHAVESALGVAVSMPELLEGTTLAELAGVLEKRLAEVPRRWTQTAALLEGEQPLSFGQRGLWFLHRLAPEEGAYNLVAAARTEDLDPEALRRALAALCVRHASLRSVFVETGGEPARRVLAAPDLDFAVADAPAWDEAWRPFELAERPPVRVRLWRSSGGSEGAWIVLLAVHHLVADFWSLALMLEELGALYAAEKTGVPAVLPEPAAGYGDYVRWQRERLAGAEGERLWAYWRERLAGDLPHLDLPTDRPRPAVQSFRGVSRARLLPPDLAGGLERLGRERGATLFMVLATAFHALLHRASGQETILVGSPTAGREAPELAGVVGYFANPVVLRADFPENGLGFAGLLKAVRRDALGAFAHAALPFPLLTERLHPERDASRNPLFQAMLVLQKAHRAGVPGLAAFALGEEGPAVRLGPLSLAPVALAERRSPFDLMLMLAAVDGGLAAGLQVAADLFDPATAARLLGHFEVLLREIVADPEQRVEEIALLTAAEREEVLVRWNDTALDVPGGLTLVDLVEAQAERTPEAPAVIHGEEALTYRELMERADQLAATLRERGVGPEVRVGVCRERDLDLVVSLFGVLKAGGAYVPLDPAYPAERLRFMTEDSGAQVILDRTDRSDVPRSPRAVPRSLAYLIYTSGSTGRPKAVAIEHRSAVALVAWAREVFSAEDLAGVLFATSVCFDLSVFELFVPLSLGGTVILAPDALALPELPAAGRVTLINTVPSAMEQLVAGPLPASLRVVNLAGEPLPGDLVRRIHERRPEVRVYNLYGPSEDTTYSTGGPVPPGERVPSIGRPVANARVYLLDRRGGPVPVGVPGELWIGGAGLARGYLGRPDLTAERFRPDPLSGRPGERLYRTGDLACWRAGGEIDFLGRVDHQVKIRGFRIELGEVEAALREHPAVREAVVVARDHRAGRRLVAYVAGDLPPAGVTGALQSFLRERLPASMVPAAVVVLDALPRTPNGKVDRKALPEPATPDRTAGYAPPRDAREEALAAIWARTLGVEQVGIGDNFFALGGDSILSLQVVARAREAGLRLTAQQVFQHQTLAELAAAAGEGAAVASQAEVTGPVPLTPIQRWFFSLDPEEPWHFNQAVRVRARRALEPRVLEGALEALLRHHDALRLRFTRDADGAWHQEGEAWRQSSPLTVVDLAALPGATREAARAAAEAAVQAGFDLARGPLFRGLLFTGEETSTLLLTAHHLVVDGVSWRILLEDLHTAYTHLKLPAKTASFREHAERVATRADLPVAEGTGKAGEVRRATFTLPAPRGSGVELEDALLSAVVEAFARRTGESAPRLDLERHGRDSDLDLSRTVGWLTEIQGAGGGAVVVNYLGRLDGVFPAASPFATAEIADLPVHGPRNRRGHALAIDAWVLDGELTVRWEHAAGPEGDAAVRELAEACLDALREIVDRDAGLEDAYSVTPLQAGILMHALASPGSGAYVQQLSCALSGELDEAAFLSAWQRLVDRHTVLRTRFRARGLDEPVQEVLREARLPVEREDWSAMAPEERARRLAAYLEEDRARGFALDRAPLARLFLARTSAASWHLVLTYHHLLLDGWSLVLLLEELLSGAGDTPPPAPFREYVDWLRRWDGAPAEAFWRRVVGDFSAPTPLAADRPVPPPEERMRHGEARAQLPAAATAALAAAARRHQLTQGTLVAAAWALLLGHLSGEEDLVFGTVTSGRSAGLPGMERRVGLFINTLPLRLRAGLDAALLPWLRDVQARSAAALRHEHTPLVDVQAWSGVPPGRRLFDSILAFENYPVDAALHRGIGGLAVSGVHFVERIDYPTAVVVTPGEGLGLQMIYDRRMFQPATVARRLEQLRRLLEGIAERLGFPGVRLGDLPWLAEAERHQILLEWNDTRLPVASGGRLIHQLFEERAALEPAAVAVVSGGEVLTYGELDLRANRLARRLRASGVGRGSLVAVHLGRSAGMVVAVLGILKAGGAYVPVEVTLPPVRVRWIAGFLGLRWVVTETARLDALRAALGDPDLPHLVAVDRETPDVSEAPLAPVAAPDDLAYIIFTSGSTGTPKGVMVQHRPVLNLIEWVNGTFGVGPDDRVLFITALSFDLSVYDIFGLLAAGGSIHVAAERDVREPARLVRLLAGEPVTFWDSAPAALQQLVPFLPAEPQEAARLRLAFLSGDWIPLGLKDEVAAAFPRVRCVGLGGATEATVWSNVHRIETVEREWRSIPYGRPIRNARYHVLDAAIEPVAVGVAGDLYIGGPVLARGYAGEPELTAGKFVPDPFADEPGAVLYRTGDRARYFADGKLEFLGRLDHQVKIRGFRIELGEIEAALGDHPGVREALVLVREDTPGDRRLVAYVVPAAGPAPDPRELRTWVADRLPAYMVPAACVVLDALPVTANGKVDRKALPTPESAGAAATVEERPASLVEELVAAQWAQVLHLPDPAAVSLDQSFFELGGQSLLATRLVARLREALDVELSLQDLFEAPTVAGLAERVEAALRGGQAGAPIERIPRDGDLPLSSGQQRLWFLDRLEPGTATWNIPAAVRLRGDLDVAALTAALRAVVARHEALRTTFTAVGELAVQVIAPALELAVPRVDLAALPAAIRDAEALRLAAAEAGRPFDLAAGPLVRMTLVRTESCEHLALVTLHHIIADGASVEVLLRELAALYPDGKSTALPELPIQPVDVAAWQAAHLASVAEARLAWWRERLDGAPPLLELPTDRPRPALQSFRGASRSSLLPPALAAGVRELALGESATPYMVLLAAFAALLGRDSGQDDLLIGTPAANRQRIEIEPLIGFFVNTLVVRAAVPRADGFRALLKRVRAAALGAWAHQDLPFERIVEELRPERSLGHHPLFQVMFTLERDPERILELPGLALSLLSTGVVAGKFDLALSLFETSAGLRAVVDYRTDLFDGVTIDRLLGRFERLLAAALSGPERPLASLDLLAAGERQQLLEWSEGPPLPAAGLAHRLVEESAGRASGRVALVCGAEEITYGELEARANRLARLLRRLGAASGARVGVSLGRTVWLPVSVLAVFKAGGVWVPLDPASPPARRRFVAEDAGVSFVLTDERLRELEGEIAAESPAPLATGPRAGDLAYLIYTSGSTGRPKGVAVEHGSLAALLGACRAGLGWTADDRLPCVAPYSFDIFLFELLAPLAAGGTVELLETRPALDLRDLLAALARATRMHAVPALMRQVVDAAAEAPAGRFAALRTLCVGGDRVPPELLADMARVFPRAEVRVLYGPTEATVLCASHRAGSSAGSSAVWDERAWIGRPLPGMALRLCDADGEPVPIGIPGEIWIGGPGVARGYWNRPDLTAGRFVAADGGRWVRSGDRARRLADGALEFLGRVDEQVKVRGFRVDPREIEAVLREHPLVFEAAVQAVPDGADDRRLVAWVVAEETEEALRSWLAERLPEYMMPAALVLLPALPLTAHGKLDRAALPVPVAGGGARHAAWTAPRTPTERELAAIWSEVLEVSRVGAADDFFALGGHSLLATRMMARVRARLGVELPLRVLFEAPALGAFAAAVDAVRGRAAAAAHLAPVPRGGPLPASLAQRRLWVLDQLEPGDPTYNMPLPVRLAGRLDPAALGAALAAVVRRHESLRTRFAVGEDGPVQEILPPEGEVPLPLVDLSALPAGRREAAARGLARREGMLPFELRRGPLVRFTLLRLAPREHVLLATLHHMVGDGWSMGVVVREIARLLAGEGSAALPPLPVQYADWVAWQQRLVAAGELEASLGWWRQRLAGASVPELPKDRPWRLPVRRPGGLVSLELPDGLADGLRGIAREVGATLHMVLLSGYLALLARSTGQEDLVLGTPLVNRRSPELEGVVGFFVNTLPLRCDLSGDPACRELLVRLREAWLDLQAHQDVPLERLVQELRPDRGWGEVPFFRTVFSLERSPLADLAVPGLRLAPFPAHNGTAKFDLMVTVVETGTRLAAWVEHAADVFDRTRAERLLAQYATLLAAARDDPARPLSLLALLSEAERHQIAVEWNDTRTAFPDDACLHELFARMVERFPDRVALRFGELAMTYAELGRRVRRLAHALSARGVGPETPVALFLERSPELIVALVATLQAGGACLPVDAGYPPERVAWMLDDAGVRVVLTRSGLVPRLPEMERPLAVVRLAAGAWDREEELPPVPVHPETMAAIFYTSGSSGRPKGVVATHRGTVRLVLEAGYVHLGPEERLWHGSNVSFDAATFEIWGALLHGGCLIGISRDDTLAPESLERAILENGISVAFLTTALFHQVAAVRPGAFSTLRDLLVGGEALDPRSLEAVLAAGGPGRLANIYGPTEGTTYSTWHPVGALAPGSSGVPIGRPISNATAWIVDRCGRPVPIGVHGELWIGGAGLSRGYLGRPDLTAGRFLPDGLSGAPGARLYRTGDLVTCRPDGAIEFLGRTDHQVKIRGFRIEPGEIEKVLGDHPSVQTSIVVTWEPAPGDKRLAAYVAGRGGIPPDPARLREHLRARLPEFMVPAAIVPMAVLPLNANGKVDRHALPDPQSAAPAPGSTAASAPVSPVAEIVAGIWAEVLRADRVGPDDDFYTLGGHSLLATLVVSRVRQAFGREVPLRALLEAPDLAGFARAVEEEVERGRWTAAAPPIAPVPRGPEDTGAPLSLAQRRLWYMDRLEPGDPAYNIPAALRIAGDLDPSLLAASLSEIVRRHETLRSSFPDAAGVPQQRIAPPAPVPVPRVDLAALPAARRAVLAGELLEAENRRPFDLARGPLLRALLLCLDTREHLAILTVHHIVSDGWSMEILVRELGDLYAAFAAGRPSPLPGLPCQYSDFAVWQQEWLEEEIRRQQLPYWRDRLAGAPAALDLPIARPRTGSPLGRFRSGLGTAVLPAALCRELRAVARRHNATLFMVLLAGWKALLHLVSGQTDLLVGTPIANRHRREVEELIGFFVNTLVLRTDLAGNPSFAELLSRVRQRTLEAHAHQDLPFDRLVEELEPPRLPGRNPFFQILFDMLSFRGAEVDLPGVHVEVLPLVETSAKFDMTLYVAEGRESIGLRLAFNADRFEAAAVDRLLADYGALLAEAVRDPGLPLSALLRPHEHEAGLVAAFNEDFQEI